jgi:hypothetical protein
MLDQLMKIDPMSPMVATPALLFAVLSPGAVLQLPDQLPTSLKNLSSLKTSQSSVLFHSLVFVMAYSAIAKAMGMSLTKADLIVPTALFILLSPGIVLSLPSTSIMSGKTSWAGIAVHTLVFAVVFAILRKTFPKAY